MNSDQPCNDCPFSAACPLKNRVKSQCLVGRNPLQAYMSVWVVALVLMHFLVG